MTIQDLITTQTRDEMLEDEITIAQEEGLETTAWQAGSVIRTLLTIFAQKLSDFSVVIVEPIKGGFGDLLSSLPWAKLWAKQGYDVTHVPAEEATGYIDITNPNATQFDYLAGELIVAHETTGKLYRNSDAVSILASTTTTDVPIAAVEVGTDSNAAPGAITVLVGPSMDGVTVTNPLAVLGADDETVNALITRAREKLAALSPDGPKEAYNYVAKTPELSATSTPITRSTTKANPDTGEVIVYLATAGGAPSSEDVDVVQAAIDEWAEPWCTTSQATAASEVTVAVTYQVWVRSALVEATITEAIETALAEFFSTLDIGGAIIPPETEGKVYADSIMVVISSAVTSTDQSLGIIRCEVTLPADDVDLEVNEVAVLGTITGTVTYL